MNKDLLKNIAAEDQEDDASDIRCFKDRQYSMVSTEIQK